MKKKTKKIVVFAISLLVTSPIAATACPAGSSLTVSNRTISGIDVYNKCQMTFTNVTVSSTGQIWAAGETITLSPGFSVNSGGIAHIRATVNPPPKTMRAAVGNTTGEHDDVLRKFVFPDTVTGFDCNVNSRPCDWSCLWVDGERAHYIPSGDTDPNHGVDMATVFYLKAHGVQLDKDGINAIGSETTDPSAVGGWQMSLGDGDPGNGVGGMRYFLNEACRDLSHGPYTVYTGYGGGADWMRPDLFNLTEWQNRLDVPNTYMNVYDKWGPGMTRNIRMVCGYSSLSNPDGDAVEYFWEHYYDPNVTISDAWIHKTDNKGLCIARGSDRYEDTPLATDYVFTEQANPVGDGAYFHITFIGYGDDVGEFEGTGRFPVSYAIRTVEPPTLLPTLKIETGNDAEPSPNRPVARAVAIDNGRDFHHEKVVVSGTRYSEIERNSHLTTDAYIEEARSRLSEEGEDVDNYIFEDISVKMVQTVREENGQLTFVEQFQENAQATFRRTIDIDGNRAKLLGRAGQARVLMNNDGSLIRADFTPFSIQVTDETDAPEGVPVMRYTDAYEEALSTLDNPQDFHLADWTWGYKLTEDGEADHEMTIFYQFEFAGEQYAESVSRHVEIRAQ